MWFLFELFVRFFLLTRSCLVCALCGHLTCWLHRSWRSNCRMPQWREPWIEARMTKGLLQAGYLQLWLPCSSTFATSLNYMRQNFWLGHPQATPSRALVPRSLMWLVPGMALTSFGQVLVGRLEHLDGHLNAGQLRCATSNFIIKFLGSFF